MLNNKLLRITSMGLVIIVNPTVTKIDALTLSFKPRNASALSDAPPSLLASTHAGSKLPTPTPIQIETSNSESDSDNDHDNIDIDYVKQVESKFAEVERILQSEVLAKEYIAFYTEVISGLEDVINQIQIQNLESKICSKEYDDDVVELITKFNRRKVFLVMGMIGEFINADFVMDLDYFPSAEDWIILNSNEEIVKTILDRYARFCGTMDDTNTNAVLGSDLDSLKSSENPSQMKLFDMQNYVKVFSEFNYHTEKLRSVRKTYKTIKTIELSYEEMETWFNVSRVCDDDEDSKSVTVLSSLNQYLNAYEREVNNDKKQESLINLQTVLMGIKTILMEIGFEEMKTKKEFLLSELEKFFQDEGQDIDKNHWYDSNTSLKLEFKLEDFKKITVNSLDFFRDTSERGLQRLATMERMITSTQVKNLKGRSIRLNRIAEKTK